MTTTLSAQRARLEAARATRFQGLTKPPGTSSDGPVLDISASPNGVFRLFKDSNWSSESATYALSNFLPGSRHLIKQPLANDATWLAWRLPRGTVLTICAVIKNGRSRRPGENDPDLSGCGESIDLIGTGETEYMTLSGVNMNDKVSMFFYRRVDLSRGAIEFFQSPNFEGVRMTLFLSEWPSDTKISFADWFMNGRTSSIRWGTLPIDTMALVHTSKGFDFAGCKGWGTGFEIRNCADYEQFNDCINAFRWFTPQPVKEVINPIRIADVALTAPQSISARQTGENRTSVDQSATVTLKREQASTYTVTLEQTSTTSFSMTVEASYEGLFASGSVSMTVSRDLSRRDERSTSNTVTVGTEISQQVAIPPNCRWEAQLIVETGQLPQRTWTTTAVRWYDIWVPDGVPDPDNNGWFRREETLRGTIAGGFASSVRQVVSTSAL